MTNEQLTRRGFLKSAALASSALTLAGCSVLQIGPRESVRKPRYLSPNQQLTVAAIGSGGKGDSDIGGAAEAGARVVGLADVDSNQAAGAMKRFPDAKFFRDYREMLVAMDDQIDAVTVSTPDHTHFPAAKMAITMGKHVYVQKPLTHTIAEARELTELARKHEVMTQMGNQGHSGEGTRLLREWIEAGLLGDVREVQYWTDRPIWPQGIGRPTDTPPVPESLDWNLWLGTAPERPYHPTYHPFKWRGFWDFGCGALGDMACHFMDAAFWALQLG